VPPGQVKIIYAPIATGRMSGNGDIETTAKGLRNFTKKGKAILVEHFLFDELWNMGNRKIPQTVKFEAEDEGAGEEDAGQGEGDEGENQIDSKASG